MKWIEIWLPALVWSNGFVCTAAIGATTFDIRKMSDGLTSLNNYFAGVGNDNIIRNPLPFFGISLNELYTEDPNGRIDKLLDLVQFMTIANNTYGTYVLSPAQIRDSLIAYMKDGDDTIEVAGTSYCTATEPIHVEIGTLNELNVTFCANIRYKRSVDLDGSGLFTTTGLPFDLTTAMSTNVTVDFFTTAVLTVTPIGTYMLGPPTLTFSLDIHVQPIMTFTVGMLELTADADLHINGMFEVVRCTTGCFLLYPNHIQLSTSNFYYSRSMSYEVFGNLTVGTNISGVDIGDTATFHIVDDDLFNPDPVINITGFNYEGILAFRPADCVTFLLLVDSALVRAQEQDLMQKNKLPFTEKSYADVLSTGSVITAYLLELFVKAEPFRERAVKSLRITFPDVPTNKYKNNLAHVDLELYYLVGELTANPSDIATLRDSVSYCNISFGRNVTTNAMLQFDLIAAINAANCSIRACGSCPKDSDGNAYNCNNCSVLVTIENERVVMVTEAWADSARNTEQDFQLLGLFSKKPVRGESILGFTLNEPVFPSLVPRFRSLKDVEKLINKALAKQMSGVNIDLTYVPPDGPEISRFEVGIEFTRAVEYGTSFDGRLEVGDLVGLKVKDSDLNITATITFSTSFGILLEPDPEEQIVILASSCNGTDCAKPAFELQFECTQDSLTSTTNRTIPSDSSLLQSVISDLATVYDAPNSSLLVIKFKSDITSVQIRPRRRCLDPKTNNSVANDTYDCARDTKVEVEPNVYKIGDVKATKNAYRVAVGDIDVRAEFTVVGDAQVSCTLLQVIEVTADLVAELQITLSLSLGNGNLIPFTDWLVALLAITAPKDEGHIPKFLKAQAELAGTFEAMVEALPPFDIVGSASATGSVTHTLDFLNISASGNPDVTLEINLPKIGDIRNLSFRDLVNIMVKAMELLVGGNSEDTVDSCSGGLLGISIGGAHIFTYQIPVLGITACSMAQYLQVVVEAVDKLLDESETDTVNGTTTTTFNTLETKLETLLQDGVGGTPEVSLKTKSDTIRSELIVEIQLKWTYSKFIEMTVNMDKILADSKIDLSGPIGIFAKSMIPTGEGGAEVQLDGSVSFTLGVGLEYVSSEKKTNAYILGSTGFQVDFSAVADFSYDVQLGPLKGVLDGEVNVHGRKSQSDPLSLRVGLDPDLSYYISDPGPTSSTRANFTQADGIGDLVKKIDFEFDGRVAALLNTGIPLIGCKSVISVEVTDLEQLIRGNKTALVLDYNVTTPTFELPSFLDILLMEPQGIIDALNDVFQSVEDATLGRKGIVSTFKFPFIRNSLGQALGAGTPDNIFGKARRYIVPTLQAGLDSFEGETNTVADVLARLMEMAIGAIGILKPGQNVVTACYHFDNVTERQLALDSCLSGNPQSLMWTIPFGQDFTVEVPLDFDLDAGAFPLEIEFSGNGNSVPQLSIGWYFNLAFGFDETAGFFLYSFPGGSQEFKVYAKMYVLDRTLTATLIMLKASIKHFHLMFGAALYVDINKAKALRRADSHSDPQYGRITRGNLHEIVKLSDMFSIGVLAGATISANETSFGLNTDMFPDALKGVAAWIPSLKAEIYAQARKEITISNRRLESREAGVNDQDLTNFMQRTGHYVRPVMRSLAEESIDLLNSNFTFPQCPLLNKTFCAKVINITLVSEKIVALVQPILDKFVNSNTTGYLDKVMDPMVLFLDKPLPGISDILQKNISVLDIADAFIGPKARADTIRAIIKVYNSMKTLCEQFEDNGGLLIAEECDVMNGFKCTGGVFDLITSRRLGEDVYEVFSHKDSTGLPTSSAALVLEERELDGCATTFTTPTCHEICTCTNTTAMAICKARKLQCKATSVQGLSFPFMSDLTSVIGLLNGGDIDIVRFIPPDIIFAFAYELKILLYTWPDVMVRIGFEFTVKIKLGFNLDSKGIREAVEQEAPLKALNSFALMDTFNGVDEAMITATAGVTISASVAAVIVKITASGGLYVEVTIDLFDPYPETSKGLVRPFELLSLGDTPLDWFEFGLRIYVVFRLSIGIGIYIGPLEFTIFEWSLEYDITLFAFEFKPSKPTPPGTLDGNGILKLAPGASAAAAAENDRLECTTMKGTTGNEDIECKYGKVHTTFLKTKSVIATGAGDVLLRNIQSSVDMQSFTIGNLTLDYQSAGIYVIADDTIVIQSTHIQAGTFSMNFKDMSGNGTLLMPEPEQPFLTTTFSTGCRSSWSLSGHSNVVVNAYEIEQSCQIVAMGGVATPAVLTIDFGYDNHKNCQNGTVVRLKTNGNVYEAYIMKLSWSKPVIVRVGAKAFKDIVVKMSNCQDTVVVEDTYNEKGFVDIQTGGGDDTIELGNDVNGLDGIYKEIIINGGSGLDRLNLKDSASDRTKNVTLSAGIINGILNGFDGQSSDVAYSSIEYLDMRLSNGENNLSVPSTQQGTVTTVWCQDQADVIRVNETMGDLIIYAGGGSDRLYFYGLGNRTVATIYGENGDDVIWIDNLGVDRLVNTLAGSRLRWSGGNGDDTMHIKLSSLGTSDIDIFDDLAGINDVNIDCANTPTVMLSRENFLANIHNASNPNSTVERINLIRENVTNTLTGFRDTASINTMVIRLNGGTNVMYFDDTFAPMEVFGGPLVDEFYIGQLYNSERNASRNVLVARDPIRSILTTEGYLTNGISHPVSIDSGPANDFFEVLRNKQLLHLKGNSGNDEFLARSYIYLPMEAVIEGRDVLFNPKPEDPDYILNSYISIDGGTMNDHLMVVGTEADDSYSLSVGNIIGGGLAIFYCHIEFLEVSADEDNDLISVRSLGEDVLTKLYASNGTDGFMVTPRDVGGVVTTNLRGHKGIVAHTVTSADPEYNNLYVPGIDVHILDKDGSYGGYVNVKENEIVHVFAQQSSPGTPFTFTVFPTSYRGGTVTVNIVSETDNNGNRYLLFNGQNKPALELLFTSIDPQTVAVSYNPNATPLTNTDENIMIKLNVIYAETTGDGLVFERTEQTMLPINVKILPASIGNTAKAVTVVQPLGNMVVTEGAPASSYDVYLRPCSDAVAADTRLIIQQSVANQLSLSKTLITGADWNVANSCRVQISVSATDDSVTEGTHFVTLRHTVKRANGTNVVLSDGSSLYADSVLVKIHDNDIAGVIVTESRDITSVVEPTSGGTLSLFSDSYTIRLSKQPSANVVIRASDIPVTTDRYTWSQRALSRNYLKRAQVLINGNPSLTLTFTPSNWNVDQTVTVTAIADGLEEGRSNISFAPQPSFLSLVQGPLFVYAATGAMYHEVRDPFTFLSETDLTSFTIPGGYIRDERYLYLLEEVQVDYLEIYSLDVRGKAPSVGTLTDTKFVGFNMANGLSILETKQPDGITYYGMEVVEIFLGDGVDQLTVINVTEAMHYLDLRGEDDYTRVKTIDGPFLIHGGLGADTVEVTSDETKLDRIRALFGCDGGNDDNSADTLILRNTNDPDVDEVLNVTRTMVEVRSMNLSLTRRVLPQDSFLIKLSGATGGNFTLRINDPTGLGSINVTSPYPTTSAELESLIQRHIIPEAVESRSCGSRGVSQCSLAVKVWEIGQTFVIFFAGERLNENVTLVLDTDNLQSFIPEWFQNKTNDFLFRNTDVVYGDLEYLTVASMGNHDIVVNVRGTTAITTINTQGGNDKFFVGSEANQNKENAGSIDFLHGWLDYVHDDLYLVANSGRHRLMISDENSTISKGVYGPNPAVLTRNSLTNIHPNLGNIYYTANGGHWSSGVNVWLGKNDDRVHVDSIPSNPGAAPLRTATQVHCGNGNDNMTVRLIRQDHDGAVFVANGQNGDDRINATESSLSVILFGDAGNDNLVGGSGDDTLIGDFGRVVWRTSDNLFDPDGVIGAIAGGGGYGDYTDGVIRFITDIYSVATPLGGQDTLKMNSGDDVGIGGAFSDDIYGDDHRDIIFGDSATIVYYLGTSSPKLLVTLNCSDGGADRLYGGPGVVDYIVGGAYNDFIEGNDGMDLVFGDHAKIDLFAVSHKLQYAQTTDFDCTGGDDTIYLGAADDIAFGGAYDDTIYGDSGQDIILGDFGHYDPQNEILPWQNYVSNIHFPDFAGEDVIYGGPDDDVLMGQEHNDTIYGDGGRDDIYGGHHIRKGKDANDTIYGGDGSDVILGDNGEIIRHRRSIISDYPWNNGMVWMEYVAPFNEEVVHEIRRYDDIDYVEGNDIIYGDAGNDILHGQRGDDIIFGGDGEDEIYGELGADTLNGGAGNDIVLGDIGYAVRRYNFAGQAIQQDNWRGASSQYVWHKDIVLEELGNITGVNLISKKVDVNDVTAEKILSSSLLFVAAAYKSDGTKYNRASDGGWSKYLLQFQLVPAYNDDIDGGAGDDVLIGQRGDDYIKTGSGNDLAIGDAGWNTIPFNMDMPRIHQIYRALADTSRTNIVAINVGTDFGATFTSEFELYPDQYKAVDSQASIIDVAANVDDISEQSNLLKDKLRVSGLSTISGSFCLQPVLRVTPGFLRATQWMHGNDRIQSGVGESIIVGDDIRGYTGLDLFEVSRINTVRQNLDNLVKLTGARLSTMEVDWEFYMDDEPIMSYDVKVASDNITTDIAGTAFVTGDTMTILGRTLKGGGLIKKCCFRIKTSVIQGIFHSLLDVQEVLWSLNFALFEIHTELLKRMRVTFPGDHKPGQQSLHHLYLSNDAIDSNGNNDISVGDSSLFYMNVDRSGKKGYEFKAFNRWQKFFVRRATKTVLNTRTKDLTKSVEAYMSKTPNIPRDQASNLPYADVPFYLTVATDTITMNNADNIVAGDYAFIGTTMSSRRVPDDQSKLAPYTDSIQNLRRSPSLNRDISSAMQFDLAIYNRRYSGEVATAMKPTRHGDRFHGYSMNNAAFGEFMTGTTYMTFTGGQSSFSIDAAANAFATVAAGSALYDGDYFDLPVGAQVNGQLGNDQVVSNKVSIRADLSIEMRRQMSDLLYDHVLFVQMRNDAWFEPINPQRLKGVKNGYQCTRANEASYIPSYSKNDIAPQNRFIVAAGAAAVVGVIDSSSLLPNTIKEVVVDLPPPNSTVDHTPHQQEEHFPVTTNSKSRNATINVHPSDGSESEPVTMQMESSSTMIGIKKCRLIGGTQVCTDEQT